MNQQLGNNSKPIGVFDSGIGGLTVLKALRAELPHENFVYLGDTARLPYGTKGETTVIDYSRQALATLSRYDIKLLVVACNTVSALALSVLQQAYPDLPMLGVLKPGAKMIAQKTQSGVVGLLATESTIHSKNYLKAIYAERPGIDVVAKACPLFVALAEEGWCDNTVAHAVAEIYLAPLKAKKKLDAVLLGCTHFPVLKQTIQSVLGETVLVLDSAALVRKEVSHCLTQCALHTPCDQIGTMQFLVTDLPERFARMAEFFFGVAIVSQTIELINVI